MGTSRLRVIHHVLITASVPQMAGLIGDSARQIKMFELRELVASSRHALHLQSYWTTFDHYEAGQMTKR